MAVLTDLASAEVKRGVKTLYGTVLTRPALLVSDGINTSYACDVNVSELDPTGTINQYYQQKKDGTLEEHGGYKQPSMLTGLPGEAPEYWNLDDSLTVNTVLHNVNIARGNADLIYADVGSPVRLDRSTSGQWEITGFSIEQPGTHTLIPVDLGNFEVGVIIDKSVTTRLLELHEIGEFQPFGLIPFGASAIYIGGTLMRVV